MKQLAFTLAFLGLNFIPKAQDALLIGKWSIVEFTVTNNDQTNSTSEDALKENKSVWDLELLNDGLFRQTSNMRNGNMESQEGTWDISEGHLVFNLKFDNRDIRIEYEYDLKDEMLGLVRKNPAGTMKIETKFKRDN